MDSINHSSILPLEDSSFNGLVHSIPSILPLWLLAPALFACYVLICSRLRFRRRDLILHRFYHKEKGPVQRSLSSMSDHEAFSILCDLSQLEFPQIVNKSLQLALFSTYGIPSITKLLTATAQLSSAKHIGKRYADTSVLFAEIYNNAPSSTRGIEAIARLNYLHSHYIRQRRISNDDMLFTLAVIMVLPVRWIEEYEWRPLSDVERCAFGVFHRSLGSAMDISFDALPSSNTGWRDGTHFFAELEAWLDAYIAQTMVPDSHNFDTAAATRTLLLAPLPRILHAFGSSLLSAIMPEPLRIAVMFEPASHVTRGFFYAVMALRRITLRCLALPRRSPVQLVSDTTTAQGRRHFAFYDAEPHYVQPTLWNRYGPSAWWRRYQNLPLPGDDAMLPNGFITKEVGPKAFEGKGAADMAVTEARLRRERTGGGCPFAVVK